MDSLKESYLCRDFTKKYNNEFIYLIREREFIRLNENTYKIGKTAKVDTIERFNGYPRETEIVLMIAVKDCTYMETKLKKIFKETFIQRLDYGIEYYTGDVKDMISTIIDEINKS